MPGTPPRRLRVVGLGHRRRRSAGRTFTLTRNFPGQREHCLASGEDSRRTFTLGSLQRLHPQPRMQAPLPVSLTLMGRPRSAPARPPSKPPRGFAELVVTRDPQTVPLSPPQPVYPQPPVAFLAAAHRGPPFPRTLRAGPLPTPSIPSPRAAAPICALETPAPLSLPAVLSAWEGVG